MLRLIFFFQALKASVSILGPRGSRPISALCVDLESLSVWGASPSLCPEHSIISQLVPAE